MVVKKVQVDVKDKCMTRPSKTLAVRDPLVPTQKLVGSLQKKKDFLPFEHGIRSFRRRPQIEFPLT